MVEDDNPVHGYIWMRDSVVLLFVLVCSFYSVVSSVRVQACECVGIVENLF